VLWRIENGQGREEDIDLLWVFKVKLEGNVHWVMQLHGQ
jgi:NADH-quinone oxidoreductase subunit F